jgi:two-component system phosphate regulon sensor histidine kinase PhoR
VATTTPRQRLGYRRIVQLLVYLVIVPTVLILIVGIILILVGESYNLLLGISTLSLVALMFVGMVLVLVFVRREANLSELQADFVSKVSHELRTPLTSIRLFVETMERAPDDDVVRAKCLGALHRDTERLTGLIERLLDWGRMEAGRKQFDLQEESPAEILKGAIAAFSPIEHSPELELESDIEEGLPNLYVDRHAIIDALLNLLNNAVKYGGQPPRVKVSARRLGHGVVFEVQDNGSGIPERETERIFDKFYRIDDRLSRERGGSGLGLAIVKHIARAHRARISVLGAPSGGSIFRLAFSVRKRPHLPIVTETGMKIS